MPTILAADTGTAINSVAVCRDGAFLAESTVACGRRHAERLLATVSWVLGEAELALEEVDALAVAIGPGSFTGLRIGTATWKGLALGANKPLVGVPSLDAMAMLAGPWAGCVCPMLDARMGEVYAAAYTSAGEAPTPLFPPRVDTVEAVCEALGGRDTYFLGDGAALYHDRIVRCLPRARFAPHWRPAPGASAVAAAAGALLDAGTPSDPALVSPVYLRASQAETARRLRNEARPA